MALVLNRPDGRDDGEDWAESYEELLGRASVSVIVSSSSRDGSGPRLHRHPYAETFVIRRGRALFTIGDEQLEGHGGQLVVVPAGTPHKFAVIGPDVYEAVHIHASETFITEWLE